MRFPDHTVQSTYASPLGPIILAAHAGKLVGVWFDGQRHQPDCGQWRHDHEHPVLQQAQLQLSAYFAGHRTTFDLPLAFDSGTDFQQTVWRALLRIPHGTTMSYGALSASLGKPAAVRATGAAVGRNPLSIIVPCHRVLGADGSLTGYAGGLARKTALLQLEGAISADNPATNHLPATH
jgi:methylated-DNA-[protein]-cysteine S-methyltransferase